MSTNKVISLPDKGRLEREAAEWFVRFDSGRVSDAERANFEDWLNQSEQHKQVLENMAGFWGGMQVFEELKDRASADDVAELLKQDKTSIFMFPKQWLVGAVAASIITVLSAVVYYNDLIFNQNYYASYRTALGEQKTIALPDGTNVILNTGSLAEVEYDAKERIVTLHKGEAFFDVAPDRKKPFSVKTDKGAVTAVGTAFSVRIENAKIDVLVQEGRVALIPAKSKTEQGPLDLGQIAPMEVSAGQSVQFAQKVESINVVEKAAMDKHLDWRDGMLSFKGDTLEEVTKELARYSDIKIEITNPELREKKIVAYYQVGEMDTMFQALNLMAGIDVEYVHDKHVRLH